VGGQTPRWSHSIRGGTGLARKPTESQTQKAATVARLPNPRAGWAITFVEKSHDQSFPLARLAEDTLVGQSFGSEFREAGPVRVFSCARQSRKTDWSQRLRKLSDM
jgi:hypothetical protein